jgi:outer membrane protein assembly factor BamA
MKKTIYRFLCLAPLLVQLHSLQAQDAYTDARDTVTTSKKRIVAIPFSFYLKTLGVSAAVDVASRGFLQDQTASTMVGLISTNGSRYLYLDATNFQVPFAKRLFFSPNINIAHYGALDVYSGLNAAYPTDVAGSNGSNENNLYRIKSNKFEGEFLFRYLLPVGYGANHVLNKVTLDAGIPTDGKVFDGNWIPFLHGRTFIEPSLIYQNQTMNFSFGDKKLRTAGYTLGLVNENVDFVANPSVGNILKLKFTNGTKAFSSTVPWKMFEGSLSVFVPIPSAHLRQQVLALNVWSRSVDSWNDVTMNGTTAQYDRPSPFVGAFLGGRYRMRGYPEARFNDKACLLYTAEYRIIPAWNPLADWSLLKFFHVQVDWMQFVFFTELGRVAPEWNLTTFHSHMKTDGGVGIRFMANQMLIRVDGAYSAEGPQLQMYLGHAF